MDNFTFFTVILVAHSLARWESMLRKEVILSVFTLVLVKIQQSQSTPKMIIIDAPNKKLAKETDYLLLHTGYTSS